MRNYSRAVKKMVEELALTEKVLFAGFASFRELITYYATAHLYLCLSEHEGFCVPLVESMFFGLPVIAYLTGGIPETLGGAGIGIAEKKLGEIAEMMALVLEDEDLRKNIIAGQKERLKDLSLEKNRQRLQAHLAPFLEGHESGSKVIPKSSIGLLYRQQPDDQRTYRKSVCPLRPGGQQRGLS